MLTPRQPFQSIILYRHPVDMRKGINGLSTLVENELRLNPFDLTLFLFISKRRDQIRGLLWDQSGFMLTIKRLEKEKFHWPRYLPGDTWTLTTKQLDWLLSGFNLATLNGHKTLSYSSVC